MSKYPLSPDSWLAAFPERHFPTCVVCGSPAKWCGGAASFRETCGSACGTKLGQQRVLLKNGGKHPSQTEEVKIKRAQTNIEKFGHPTALHSATAIAARNAAMAGRAVTEKIEATMISRYGAKRALQVPQFAKKAEATLFSRFGVKNSMFHPQLVEKNRRARRSSYVETSNFFIKSDRLAELGYSNIFPLGYLGTGVNYQWTHACGEIFEQVLAANGGLPRCPTCHKTGSHVEEMLAGILSASGINIVRNNRSILSPLEIDIWLPEYNVGIEINGEYWHSADDRLLEKTQQAELKKVRLLHFWANEIENKLDVVLNIIYSVIGSLPNRVYARNCDFVQLSSSEAHEFLNKNHLAAGAYGSRLNLGLITKSGEIVAVTTYCKSRFSKKAEIELLRFACAQNTLVIGGLSKLISKAKVLLDATSIVTYADRRISTGAGCLAVGGRLIGISKPGYSWYGYVKNTGWVKLSRAATQKHKLSALLGEKYSHEMSERENMLSAGWNQLKDCGNLVFVL